MESFDNEYVVNLMKERGIIQGNELSFDVFKRVVSEIEEVEKKFEVFKSSFRSELLEGIRGKKIIFGTPILANCGRKKTVSACAIVPIDIEGLDVQSIVKICLPYYKSGMGTGFDFSQVENPVEKLKELNKSFSEIQKECSRPIACLGSISCYHEKVLDFIRSKRDEDYMRWKFNISVVFPDRFMEKLLLSEDVDNMRERNILHVLSESAHYCGEPGMLLIDRFEEDNVVPDLPYHTVAPCAEIGMHQGEVCHYGYINVSQFLINDKNSFDFGDLRKYVRLMTRALDNCIEITSKYIEDEKSKALLLSKRRIGIGICGLAELFLRMGMVYGEDESVELVNDIFSNINFYSKTESVALSKERGPFKLFHKSKYYNDRDWFCKKFMSKKKVKNELQHEDFSWELLYQNILKFGLRNSSTVCQPSTGTSSRILCTSASIEPIFSVFGERGELIPPVKNELERIVFEDSQIFNEESQKQKEMLLEEVVESIRKNFGSVQHLGQRSSESFSLLLTERNLLMWQCAQEISIERQMKILVAVQKNNDCSTSKTFNISNDTNVDTIRELYLEAFRSGLKGIAVFRDGCLSERSHM